MSGIMKKQELLTLNGHFTKKVDPRFLSGPVLHFKFSVLYFHLCYFFSLDFLFFFFCFVLFRVVFIACLRSVLFVSNATCVSELSILDCCPFSNAYYEKQIMGNILLLSCNPHIQPM